MKKITQSVLDDLQNIDHDALFKSREPISEIYAYYLEYLATGEFPFLETVAVFVEGKLPALNETQKSNLRTHVYYSSSKYRKMKEKEYEEQMILKGWNILTCDTYKSVVRDNFTRGHKLIICRKRELVLFGDHEKTDTFRPFVDSVGTLFLMKPRATKKGYHASQFIGAFYKIT